MAHLVIPPMSAFDPLRTSGGVYPERMFRLPCVIIAASLSLAGCGGDKPSAKLVTNLEERLAKDACLRDLPSLRREYRFATRGDKIDRNLVDVQIRKAGYSGLPAGKFVLEPIQPNSGMMLDDGQYFAASATYRIGTDELDLWACGMNFGGLRHEPRF